MGLAFRVISRLDIKGKNLIKGVRMEGLRIIGKPSDYAKKYADEGADELLYMDTVASLYGRNQLHSLLEETCEHSFVPITVGGGIRSVEDVRQILRAGADKVAINTGAISNPILVKDVASHFGSQCVVVSIEAKRVNGNWECFTDCGRERTGKDAVCWAHEAAELGAGELLITSIDQDGTRGGFDSDLLSQIEVDIPVIASGGMGCLDHLDAVLAVDAVAIGTAFHYGDVTIPQVKSRLSAHKEVRWQ